MPLVFRSSQTKSPIVAWHAQASALDKVIPAAAITIARKQSDSHLTPNLLGRVQSVDFAIISPFMFHPPFFLILTVVKASCKTQRIKYNAYALSP
jgi:hypothetical protein